jgi:hypothetical protein
MRFGCALRNRQTISGSGSFDVFVPFFPQFNGRPGQLLLANAALHFLAMHRDFVRALESQPDAVASRFDDSDYNVIAYYNAFSAFAG